MKCQNVFVQLDYRVSTVQNKPVLITAQEMGLVLKGSVYATKASQETIVVKKHALMIVQEMENAINLQEHAYVTNSTGARTAQKKVALMTVQETVNA
jgi:hypothetical protein